MNKIEFHIPLPSITKIKEKRERQPNWTEAEKQLLLSLTRMHQLILENKGCDALTIKRKSEAWDDILNNMQAAGYYRTKQRLKQQLGRIRATEAKKAKDALAKSLPQINNDMPYAYCNADPIIFPNNQPVIRSIITPMHNIAIKVEEEISIKDFDSSSTEWSSSNTEQKQPLNLSSSPSLPPPPPSDIHDYNKQCHGSQFMNIKNSSTINEAVEAAADAGDEVDEHRNKLKRMRRFRINGYSPRSRAQRVRQLHLYKLAVEKERLRMMRLQQKRERIFYEKDKQIQDLKLEILRNLAVNRINHINFN